MRSSARRVHFALAVQCGLLGLLPSLGASQVTPIRISPRDPVLTAGQLAQPQSLCQTFTASTVDATGAVTGVAPATWIATNGSEFWADSLKGIVCLKTAAPSATGSRTSVIAYAIGSGAIDSTSFSVMPAPARIATGQNPTVFRGTRPTREPVAVSAPATIVSPMRSDISLRTRPAGAAPTGVVASSGSPVSATISWTAAAGAVSYLVSRGSSPQGPFNPVTTSPLTVTSFVDRTLAPGTTYYWIVSANSLGLSAGLSAPVSATTRAAKNPTGFTAAGTKVGEILLTWNAQADVAHYWLQGDGLPAREVTSASYTATGLTPGLHNFSLITYFGTPGGPLFADEANPSKTRGAALAKNTVAWLLKPNGAGSATETGAYYAAIGAVPNKDTFTKWKQANGFPADEVRARYFNAQDLNLGRDTHCRVNAGRLACYQSNSGPSPASPDFPNATAALADIVSGAAPFATVAMDVDANNRVNFYAFNNANDSIVVKADLDTEGKKFIPNACTACHGGRLDAAKNLNNASFLPFDVFGFRFASAPGFTLADQQEAFRKLNSLVKASKPNLTNPHNPIVTFIDGTYGGNVDVAGATASDNWVPAGWATKPNVYDVFKRTCRTCHMAVDSGFDFTSYNQLIALKVRTKVDVCGLLMPHAETPYRRFWLSTNVYLPAYWADPSVFGISCP